MGSGIHPTAKDDVTVAYKGYFTNGDIIDKIDDKGVSFNLSQVIKGWEEGITYFKAGGSGTILVPSHLAYGSMDIGPIPSGSILIFDIKLININ